MELMKTAIGSGLYVEVSYRSLATCLRRCGVFLQTRACLAQVRRYHDHIGRHPGIT